MLLHWLVFLGVLAASGLLLCASLVMLMARTLLRPRRMTDARATWILKRLSPGDLDLPFEDMRFIVRDKQAGRPLHLAGWWIGARRASDRTILLIHGYADAKVGAIAWAPALHALGWNILAIDLRAHGESEGHFSTAGFWERHDVCQIIDELDAQRPSQTRQVAIFGVSLGSAVAVAAAAQRDDIAGIILESPFGDYRLAVAAHGRMRGLPGGPLREIAISLAERMSGADFRAVRPRDLLARVACPVMLIHAGDDPFIPDEDAAHLKMALEARRNPGDIYWSISAAGHVLGLAAVGMDEYQRRLGEFLDRLKAPAKDPIAHLAAAGGENATCSEQETSR